MLIDRTIDYSSLPRDAYYRELGKVGMRSAIFGLVIAFVGLFVVGTGLRLGYAAEAPRAELPAPVLSARALTHAHYDVLNETEQQAYETIEDALRGMKGGASLPAGVDCDMLNRAYDAVLMDNPDIFWVSINYFSYRNIGPAGIPFVTFNYLYDDPREVESRHAVYLSEAKELAESFDFLAFGDSEAKRAREAYDWLSENLDYAHTDMDQTVSGAFDEDDGYTVCAGYAKSFKLLCDQMGIPCAYISGSTNTSSDSRHAWNMMVADGYVYYVDATWGDEGGFSEDQWFTTSPYDFEAPYREPFDPELVKLVKGMGTECVFCEPVSDVPLNNGSDDSDADIRLSDTKNIWDIAFGQETRVLSDSVAAIDVASAAASLTSPKFPWLPWL